MTEEKPEEKIKLPKGYEKVHEPLRKGWRDGIVRREVKKDEEPS